MPDNNWNPWKMTTLAILLVIATALVTGLVVASWNDTESPKSASTTTAPTGQTVTPKSAASKPAAPKAVAAKPTAADVEACNLQARSSAGDKTLEGVDHHVPLIGVTQDRERRRAHGEEMNREGRESRTRSLTLEPPSRNRGASQKGGCNDPRVRREGASERSL